MSTLMAGSREEAMVKFRRHWTYLSGPNAAQSLWRKLTPTQKQQVGGSLSRALTRYGRPTQIWMHLQPQISEPRAVVELAMKLFSFPADEAEWLLREMGELPMDDEEAQEVAISRGHLVLVRETRSLFWKGSNCNIDWGNATESWETLVIMCESALRNEDIDRFSFPGEAHEDVVAKKKSRLKSVKNVPAGLIRFLRPVAPRTQRFTYPADEIHIFDD
ncbi:hypothetical protein [Blastopirellula retiformator]|uniref:Uncharacterized protein n=1 Tax=Blastopirellula retiformator TaxID=2527970 RepID=A0A5C5VK07_9BACT|nr:hypothetical protein [Blastopirellula retiformator]TWT38948.1 hypothetical protein Enr8_06420 [Blastopirellula retiformator]